MRKLFQINLLTAFLTLSSALLLASCEVEKPTTPTPTPPEEANTVTGIVVNSQGQPMEGVKVRADNPNGNNIHSEVTTDAAGRYKIKLTSIGSWKIYAWKEVQFMDKTYNLRLGMKNATDYDAFTTEGKTVVRDFVWKLDGRIPDRSASSDYGMGYFGGSLYFVNLNGKGYPPMAPGTKVTVTLTPVSGAKYLDGTPATTTVTKSFTITDGNSNYYIGDIKVANYRMSIKGEHNGVERVVWMGHKSSIGDFFQWLDFYFDPEGLSVGSYESGIKTGVGTPFYLAQP